MDINSIIEMINNTVRPIEKVHSPYRVGYDDACDDIIEQLRKMSDETIAWESTTEAYKKYITESQYQKFSDDVKKWYKPYCKMSDWQPIETAPKHTEVLVWREDAGVFIAQLTTPDNVMSDQEIEEYFPDGFGDFEEWFCASYGWQEGSEKPTHWMPLPKQPSKAM